MDFYVDLRLRLNIISPCPRNRTAKPCIRYVLPANAGSAEGGTCTLDSRPLQLLALRLKSRNAVVSVAAKKAPISRQGTGPSRPANSPATRCSPCWACNLQPDKASCYVNPINGRISSAPATSALCSPDRRNRRRIQAPIWPVVLRRHHPFGETNLRARIGRCHQRTRRLVPTYHPG